MSKVTASGAVRRFTGQFVFINATAQDPEAPAGMDAPTITRIQAAGWAPERITAFHELQASAPIHKNR